MKPLNARSTRSRWRHILPHSKLIYPTEPFDRIKYYFWRFYTPLHPVFRNILVTLRIVHHYGRQEFLIGIVAPNESLESVAIHLVAQGFGNDFVAWRDEGEVVSLRKVIDFKHQYHIRLFYDGEVRGHYEYTPEASPFLHLEEVDFFDKREDFLAVLGELVVPHRPSV